MKLNHMGITATDVFEAREFLEKSFKLEGIGENNHNLTHVCDENRLILSIFKGSRASEPETTHIGFIQESEAEVDEMYRRLKEDGFEVSPPRRSHGGTFHFVAPGGFAIEVLC